MRPATRTVGKMMGMAAEASACCGVSRTTVQSMARSPERSEEHTSELQSQPNLVCRLLLEKKKQDLLAHPVVHAADAPQAGTHQIAAVPAARRKQRRRTADHAQLAERASVEALFFMHGSVT